MTTQLGWALLAAGSVFFWTVAVISEARLLLEERNVEWQEKAGVVLRADSTRSLEGKERVWKYVHSVSVNGKRYKGTSYSVGKKFDSGQIAYICYDAAAPRTNYVTGLRRNEFSSNVDWLLLLPFFTVVFNLVFLMLA
ncbi:MAG TPA: hypothetical protein ENJ95_19320 [Bacteroidetes bacterium]|nr:hypothetical protein [Bacteroidota bacterium]